MSTSCVYSERIEKIKEVNRGNSPNEELIDKKTAKKKKK